MRPETLRVVLVWLVVALHASLCANIVMVGNGCGSTPPTLQNAAQAADVAAYAALQDDCVAGSANRAAALACIADVRKRWCGPGGADASIPVGPAIGKLIDRMFPEAGAETVKAAGDAGGG